MIKVIELKHWKYLLILKTLIPIITISNVFTEAKLKILKQLVVFLHKIIDGSDEQVLNYY